MDEFINISEEDLKEIISNTDWKGRGTIFDPYIFESADLLPQSFRLEKSSIYIQLLNCKFETIDLTFCSNLIFESCTFNDIRINGSTNLEFNSCSISSLGLSGASFNIFERSTIGEIRNWSSYGNKFISCSLSFDDIDALNKELFDFASYSKILLYIAVIVASSLLPSVMTGVISGRPNILLILGQSLAFLLLLSISLFLKLYTKKQRLKPPNKVLYEKNNNRIIE